MRNVRRSVDHEVLVRMLCEKPHPISQKSLFPTMRELICFAAALGYQQDRRIPLSGKTHEIDARIIENSEAAIDMVYLVALAGIRDVHILMPDREDDAVTVFEEYANGGLAILEEWMAATPGDIDGDLALLNGFRANGMLGNTPPSVDTAISDVTF